MKIVMNNVLKSTMLVVMMNLSFVSFAQDAVTDDELLSYAKVMLQIDSMKADMKAQISEAVKSNELMEGGKMFNKLNKAKGDTVKIAASGATVEQLMAYDTLQVAITAYKSDFKAQYTAVVKNDIGGTTFNKVKKALKADAELKTKYNELLVSLQPKEEEEPTAGE